MIDDDNTYNPDGLTQKALRFCEEYVIDFNKTKAEMRAGYLPAAGPSLNDPRIIAEITRRKKLHSDQINISVAQVLNNLLNVAQGSLFDHVEVDENGNLRGWDFAKATDLQRRGIKKIKSTKYGLEVEMYDAVAANIRLGQYLGMWDGDEKASGDAERPERIQIEFVQPEPKTTDNG